MFESWIIQFRETDIFNKQKWSIFLDKNSEFAKMDAEIRLRMATGTLLDQKSININ